MMNLMVLPVNYQTVPNGISTGTGQNGWGNQELQSYTNKPQKCLRGWQGNLVLTAISPVIVILRQG
ncbi:MAG: hypothetical protein IPH57_19000 [Saprospiraceae bacterium]|nr:hypothetical protein [Saprospiraceae bacterium]